MAFPDLGHAIKMLWSHYGRNLTREGQDSWIAVLKKHDGPLLRSVFLSWVQTETSLPTTAGILTRLYSRQGSTPPPKYEQTANERTKSEGAAVKSMLWLHYFKGWQLRDFGGHILGRAFGRDPLQALEDAKLVYSKEDIGLWMEATMAQEAPDGSRDYTERIRQPKANLTRSSWADLTDDDVPSIG